ncbi:MAG: hypothetical protein GX025_10985 [Clostridiales bacterium]|nr:hypothetical protein [Clostridiales bacterium]
MSFKNFIPTVWNANIETKLKEYLVFEEFCNNEYKGEITGAGDSIRFLGVERPTILEQNDGGKITLGSPESVKDSAVTMNIMRQAYFNYGMPDIDAAIAKGNIKGSLSEETTRAVADVIDKNIASVVNDAGAKKLYAGAAIPVITETNVLDILDKGLEKLYENHVPLSETVEVVFTPRFNTIFKKAYTHVDTDNSAMMKNGLVTYYNTLKCKMSNNVVSSQDGTTDFLLMRTKKAVGFAKPLTFSEAIRWQDEFLDVVRGFTLYDRKILRPNELIVIPVKYA